MQRPFPVRRHLGAAQGFAVDGCNLALDAPRGSRPGRKAPLECRSTRAVAPQRLARAIRREYAVWLEELDAALSPEEDAASQG